MNAYLNWMTKQIRDRLDGRVNVRTALEFVPGISGNAHFIRQVRTQLSLRNPSRQLVLLFTVWKVIDGLSRRTESAARIAHDIDVLGVPVEHLARLKVVGVRPEHAFSRGLLDELQNLLGGIVHVGISWDDHFLGEEFGHFVKCRSLVQSSLGFAVVGRVGNGLFLVIEDGSFGSCPHVVDEFENVASVGLAA